MRWMRDRELLRVGGLLAVAAVVLAAAAMPGHARPAERKRMQKLDFDVRLDVLHRELSPEFCWFHPRAAAIPGAGRDGHPAVIVTLQKHLRASDHYSGLYTMRSDDLGKTWTGPTEVPELGWVHEPNGVTVAVADVTPGWHPQTRRLIAIGAQVRYNQGGDQLEDTYRAHQTAYAVHDPRMGAWSRWKRLEMPPDKQFDYARSACAQWLVQPDGTLLVPLYIGRNANEPMAVTVAQCAFDGQELKCLRHGNVMELNVERGLCEPSVAFFGGRYYLTIRNDVKGYVTVSEDGLHYRAIQPWVFDDGTELGSYNTQQHWVAHSDGLYLSYTRRGANNDHIPRSRAPIFIARVDPERLCVLRDTERVLIPERGAMLGNFGACAISPRESWVTDAEYIMSDRPDARGADGSAFIARIIWSRPNRLAPRR